MKKVIRIGLLVLLVLFGIIQLIPVDRSVPPYDEQGDLLLVEQPSAEVAQLMKDACYDCHSYQTEYPWYAYVAPGSWFLQDHIAEGREHLNFSIWTSYEAKKRSHKLEECIEEVKEGEMPMKSYTLLHSEANLTANQKELLYTWWQETRMKQH